MSIAKEKKQKVLKELQENFEKSKIIIFVNFHGLKVSASTKLRRLLREIGAKYMVAKKTLIKKAIEKISPSGERFNLDGEVGIAFSCDDPIEPAKILDKFSKENKALTFIGGIYEGKFINQQLVKELANIPSREILLNKLVYILNSPQRGLVNVLSGTIRNFISVLNEIKKLRS